MMHFKCPWIQCRTYFLHWVYPLMIQPPNLPQEIADIPRTPMTVFSLRCTVYGKYLHYVIVGVWRGKTQNTNHKTQQLISFR